MFDAGKVKLILLEEFAVMQIRNPRYSMRAYAKKIGISQAAISEILAGKRNLTLKSMQKIMQNLGRHPEEVLHAAQSQPYEALNIDTYHMIADWYYYAILSLFHTEGFQSSPHWIAKRLGLSVKTVQDSLLRLQKLNLIKIHPKTKKLSLVHNQVEISASVAQPALKKACHQNIDLARAALDETQFIERDFTAITLCFDPERMNEAKDLIKSFRRSFSKIMESKKKKEVYKLTVQLFPLTKTKRGSQ